MKPIRLDRGLSRRHFLKISAMSGLAAGAVGRMAAVPASEAGSANPARPDRKWNGPYRGAHLDRIAFPLGGIGAGMVCLEGTGAISHVSLRNRPDVFNEPCTFAAISVRGWNQSARILEGPVPDWKIFGGRDTAMGLAGSSLGLPRFTRAEFEARFPFASVTLHDDGLPLEVRVTGWSPFIPGDADNSSLPMAALEYRLTNRSGVPLEAAFSYNSINFMAAGDGTRNGVFSIPGGFVLCGAGAPERIWEEGCFAAAVHGEPEARVNHAWFRGGFFDPLTMAWKDVETGACYERVPVTDPPPPGASLFVPVLLAPGAIRTVRLRLCWHVPRTNLGIAFPNRYDPLKPAVNEPTHIPWYAGRFPDIGAAAAYWAEHYDDLRRRSQQFADCLHDTTLPPEIVEAVAANLGILKSPTVLRQPDGRLWAWEGSGDDVGLCTGSCTHVWGYAQAVAHLFPSLERALRETELGPSQDSDGYQLHRALLPIRPPPWDKRGDLLHDFPPVADGQLGGIMKVHREWRISGDTDWLRGLWPRVKQSLDFCTATWDPKRQGWIAEPHLNTYDMEFWGPNGMTTSIYLGALRAAMIMGEALGDDTTRFKELYQKGVERMERDLFDGEYFAQKIMWKELRDANLVDNYPLQAPYSSEARVILEKEGPKYQYGAGCLSDGVLGAWLAQVCGVGDVLDQRKVASHLRAVHRHNLKQDLSTHANPQRPTFALGRDGGLLLCSWPKGGELSLPFPYAKEVWTGIEYQVASHLILIGAVSEGLEIVRACRARYDGRVRNPFDEYECGHWYGRALSSYGLLQAWSGARYDAVDRILHLRPSVAGDFRCFLSTATGYGSVGVREGKPFLEVKSGRIEVREIKFVPRNDAQNIS